jgi:hypothetical protein
MFALEINRNCSDRFYDGYKFIDVKVKVENEEDNNCMFYFYYFNVNGKESVVYSSVPKDYYIR